VVQRGEDWLLQRIWHTVGIYGFFARLALAARQESEHALCWWETGHVCERCYRVHEQWYVLRPDALVEYRIGQHQMRFWLEWDRSTLNVRDLTVKFTSYAHYIVSREWMREDARLPRLLCIVPDISQERRMQRVAQTRIMSLAGLVLWTTTDVLLSEHGPLSPIWLQGMPQRNQEVQPGGSLRQSLSDILPS
jgi:hypothetical protein